MTRTLFSIWQFVLIKVLCKMVDLDLYRGWHWYIMRLFKGTGALQSILL
jgi:hypothetical protein